MELIDKNACMIEELLNLCGFRGELNRFLISQNRVNSNMQNRQLKSERE